MKTPPETEVLYRVWYDGCCIEVGDSEVPDCLELRTVGEKNVEYFGPLNISMDPAFARQLGQALIALADLKESQSE